MSTINHSSRPDLQTGSDTRFQSLGDCFKPQRPFSDRLIGLVFLSHGVPKRLISNNTARKLQQETNQSVLLVNLQFKPSHGVPRIKQIPVERLNGSFGLTDRLQVLGHEVHQLNLPCSGMPAEAPTFFALLEHCREHFGYVLVQLECDLSVAFLLECLSFVDRSFLFIQPTRKDVYLRDLLLRELRVRKQPGGLSLKTVVCREKGESQTNDLLKNLGPSVQGFIHGCPAEAVARRIHTWNDRQFLDDIRRLARELGHRRVGLVLSSGGARGLSHIGVIQVLEENGIDVDIVSGCSMGSYVGAVWAYGYDGVHMEKLAREVEHRWGLIELLDPFLLPRRGFLRGEKLKRRLKRSIGDVHFSELARPLRVVATNHTTLERVIFSTGEVAEAVHASSAIPGACVPVNIHGELYIDGGVCDPLPVDVLRELGVERIIAVNTIPTPSYLRCSKEMKREHDEVLGKRKGRLAAFFNTYFNYFAPGNVLDTIFRSFHGAQIRVAEQSCKEADLVLRPLCWDGRWHDFRHPGKYIAIGRREAEEHLAEIKALVNRKDPRHEKTSTGRALASTV